MFLFYNNWHDRAATAAISDFAEWLVLRRCTFFVNLQWVSALRNHIVALNPVHIEDVCFSTAKWLWRAVAGTSHCVGSLNPDVGWLNFDFWTSFFVWAEWRQVRLCRFWQWCCSNVLCNGDVWFERLHCNNLWFGLSASSSSNVLPKLMLPDGRVLSSRRQCLWLDHNACLAARFTGISIMRVRARVDAAASPAHCPAVPVRTTLLRRRWYTRHLRLALNAQRAGLQHQLRRNTRALRAAKMAASRTSTRERRLVISSDGIGRYAGPWLGLLI